jgi:hypothetical protein
LPAALIGVFLGTQYKNNHEVELYLKLFDSALVLSLLCTDWPLLPPGWLSVSESTVMLRAERFFLIGNGTGKDVTVKFETD